MQVTYCDFYGLLTHFGDTAAGKTACIISSDLVIN